MSRSGSAGRLVDHWTAPSTERAPRPSARRKAPPLAASLLTPTTARIVALVGVCLFFAIVNPFFLKSSNLLNVMQNTVVVGIVAAPLTLLLVARQVDLSVGSAVASGRDDPRGRGRGRLRDRARRRGRHGRGDARRGRQRHRHHEVPGELASSRRSGRWSRSAASPSSRAAGRNIRVDDFDFLGRTRFDILGLNVPLAVVILIAVLAVLLGAHEPDPLRPAHVRRWAPTRQAALLAGIRLERNVVIGFLLTGLVGRASPR